MSQYAFPEMLAETAWVEENLNNPQVRIVEVDDDVLAFEQGHIPGAVGWNWTIHLCDPVRRDILAKPLFEELMAKSGIANDTTVILYGDNHNWFAAWALWEMKIYGHADVRLMNGGRRKWLDERRPLSAGESSHPMGRYVAQEADHSIRAFLPDVREALRERSAHLVDVRTPDEFAGRVLAPPGERETCQRGGHIPGARNIPWNRACKENGAFKPVRELRALYENEGITPDRPVITYCRIGERSSHSWFALKYLLGYPDVRNYDGSWTEWGNLIGAPVERTHFLHCAG
jgi:thiosulfate/3-mercaptopyruvate sulfurtransferase